MPANSVTLYGLLELNANDRVYVNTIGQRIVWEAAQEYIKSVNDDLAAAFSVFVEETTSEFARRYKLPGGGYMQERNKFSRPAQIQVKGEWDVQFPIQDFVDGVITDDIDLAYMTIQDMQRTLESVRTRAANTNRRMVLQALYNNTNWSVIDNTGKGTLTIKPLANGDTDKYPPLFNADDVATEQHYLSAGYAGSAISDVNHPMKTIKDELEEHFGGPTIFGQEIIIFGPKAHTDKIEALADYVSINDMHIDPGVSAKEVIGTAGNIPGVLKGRGDGYWYAEWQRLPDNYLIGLHLAAPAPLIRRIDEAGTGLGDGSLSLVNVEDEFPFVDSTYRQRHGVGVGNRLNGVVVYLSASAYTVPTALLR